MGNPRRSAGPNLPLPREAAKIVEEYVETIQT